jgi:hypothetical protein
MQTGTVNIAWTVYRSHLFHTESAEIAEIGRDERKFGPDGHEFGTDGTHPRSFLLLLHVLCGLCEKQLAFRAS